MNYRISNISHIECVKVTRENSGVVSIPKLLYIPGMSGTASESREMLASLTGIECVAMSLRGRGKSTAPDQDFSFEAHVRDLRLFLDTHGTEIFYVHSYSVSTAFVLAAVAQNGCPQPKGLIIGDYPARYSKLSEGWASWFSKLLVGGHPITENLSLENMLAIERDSEDIDLTKVLQGFDFPVLILKSNGTSPAPSPITADDLKNYQQNLRKWSVVEFESDHFFRDRERKKYVQTLLDFVR